MDKEPALIFLGKKLRELREGKGLSQEDLAFQAGLDRTYIGGVERGERNFTILSALKISGSLGVSLSQVLKGVEDE